MWQPTALGEDFRRLAHENNAIWRLIAHYDVKAHGVLVGLVKLDVSSAADAEAAAQATLERFGRIDVLVNNAASFYAGYFEELSPEQMELQLSTSLGGPINVTRAFLPAMRKLRSGKVISISSSAGLMGSEFNSAYSASKFGLDGWMEALQAEVDPFGIQTMIVNPGFFRTELLTEASTNYRERLDNYLLSRLIAEGLVGMGLMRTPR
ncbi:hypothetical protein CO656_23850 [Sinorhizobium sp. FG01]|nr:hypothetical protein CO656_23850 [Sinorhizobium sp. FG01]